MNGTRASAGEKRHKVLIVDDMPTNIEVLYKILKGDYDILFAKSGADAIRIVRDQLPDLILLDIMMPEMDGYEVCEVLKGDPLTAKVPIVFVTAMGNEEDETKGLECGAIDYITKPISPPIVLARVKNHLQLKQSCDLLERLTTELEEKNRELEILAREDGLTGLANRRCFDHALKQEVQRAMRNHRSLALIICDVDHFKNYNDRYGHVAGDKCLQTIGSLLKGSFKRAGEVAARYGGEEFAVVLPDTDAEKGAELGERLRRALEDLALPHVASDNGAVTISVGVVAGMVARGLDAEWFVREADEALYLSKTNGRNRVTVIDCAEAAFRGSAAKEAPKTRGADKGDGDAGETLHPAAQPCG